jgi:hypothetical protein
LPHERRCRREHSAIIIVISFFRIDAHGGDIMFATPQPGVHPREEEADYDDNHHRRTEAETDMKTMH